MPQRNVTAQDMQKAALLLGIEFPEPPPHDAPVAESIRCLERWKKTELKHAYKERARALYPDLSGVTASQALIVQRTRALQEVNDAYELLKGLAVARRPRPTRTTPSYANAVTGGMPNPFGVPAWPGTWNSWGTSGIHRQKVQEGHGKPKKKED